MLYRLLFDSNLQDQWFLSTPVDASGDEWAFWRLLEGKELQGSDLDAWRTEIKQDGQALAWSFAGFDVPIVSQEVAGLGAIKLNKCSATSGLCMAISSSALAFASQPDQCPRR